MRAFADSLRAERGVAFGELNVIGVETGDAALHTHGVHRHQDGAAHLTPVLATGRTRGPG